MKIYYFAILITTLNVFTLFCKTSLEAGTPKAALKELVTPAGDGSTQPNLVISRDGRVILSWLEPAVGDIFALRFSVLGETKWSSAKTVYTSNKMIRFWGELPAVHFLTSRTVAASWAAASVQIYDVNLAVSPNAGLSWSKPLVPHKDRTRTEHGLISSLPWRANSLLAIWLDGRNHSRNYSGPGKNQTSLRTALFTTDGKVLDQLVLDQRVCDCCPTSAVLVNGGALIAYRDRSDDEVRDISIVRFFAGKWSKPTDVSKDGWVIKGCPVNGPALSAYGSEAVLAWFSAAHNSPVVKVSFSHDGGKNFSQALRIDSGHPLGKVDIALLPDGRAIVAWLEQLGKSTHFQLRTVSPTGALGNIVRVSTKTAGMPRLVARRGAEVLLAWTESSKPTKVRIASLEVSASE